MQSKSEALIEGLEKILAKAQRRRRRPSRPNRPSPAGKAAAAKLMIVTAAMKPERYH